MKKLMILLSLLVLVAAVRAKIAGWSDPADYTPVRDCLTTIKYGAFGVIQ